MAGKSVLGVQCLVLGAGVLAAKCKMLVEECEVLSGWVLGCYLPYGCWPVGGAWVWGLSARLLGAKSWLPGGWWLVLRSKY